MYWSRLLVHLPPFSALVTPKRQFMARAVPALVMKVTVTNLPALVSSKVAKAFEMVFMCVLNNAWEYSLNATTLVAALGDYY
jgi:hypothetical protein